MKNPAHILVLGTGGTIAGTAAHASDHVGYQAGVVSVTDLLHTAGASMSLHIETRQICQIDSKDMDAAIWLSLLQAVQAALKDDAITAIVITHGTDTIEETAALLAWGLGQPIHKPVILTCAMRPATALFADGPQNLRDALLVAQQPQAQGVAVVAAGKIHAAADVYKVHTYRLDAFDSFDQGLIGCIEEQTVRWLPAHHKWIAQATQTTPAEPDYEWQTPISWADWTDATQWPRVEWLNSYADSSAALVDALLLAQATAKRPLRGLVIAGTGNGTLHEALLPALRRAADAGVVVWRTSRCVGSSIVTSQAAAWPRAVPWGPSKARIALMLTCIASDLKNDSKK